MRPVFVALFAVSLMLPTASMVRSDEVLVEPPIVVMELPEGYPWKIGDATIALDGVARVYTTYDFSIGAFDSAVQFREDLDCSGKGSCEKTGKTVLWIRAHPDGNPDAEGDVVYVQGVFPKMPKTGKKTRDVTVEVRDVGGEKGKYLKSKGPAKMTMTSVKRGKDSTDYSSGHTDAYGRISVVVMATVCEATEEKLIKGGECHAFSASYETEVQYDGV